MALRKDPGFIASCAVHGAALAFLLLNLNPAPKFTDATEAVPVEMVSASDLTQVTAGEKTAKPLPVPQRRADKVAALTEAKPLPPLAEAKKDVPLPPSPDKPQADPGEAEKPVPTPPQKTAALPPPEPPAPPKPAVTEPEPPRRPPPEAPKAEDKPAPPDAEAIEPKPVPRPKKEAEQPVPKPPEKRPVKEAKAPEKTPEPPKKPEPRLKLDEVAKLLEKTKDEKPASKPRAGNEARDEPHRRDFNPDQISALLDHETPQRKASTGEKLTREASLGLPNAHAATLSASMLAQLDQILIDQYHGCWSYFGLGAAHDYVPEIRVHLAQDGSLSDSPVLVNPPNDPNLRSLAESAVRAVKKCNPMKIPARFAPYYDQWSQRLVRFDPQDML